MVTKFIFLFIICVLVSVPVSAEILEFSSPDVKIYSDVNTSWDYSTRYELQSTSETSENINYDVIWYDCLDISNQMISSKLHEYMKPISITINHDLNSNLKTVIAKSNRVVDPSFVEASSFYMMDGEVLVGFGLFWMWADELDNKLLYMYEFASLNNLSGIGTYDIDYADDSIFVADSYIVETHTVAWLRCFSYVDVLDSESVYLNSVHYNSYSGDGSSTYADFVGPMATINTITNSNTYENNVYYFYNVSSFVGYVEIDNKQSSYRLGLTHNFSSSNTESSNDYYIFDPYNSLDVVYNNQRLLGIKFDLYVDPTDNTPMWSYVLDWGGSYRGPTGYYATTSVDWGADNYIIGDTGSISYLIDDYDSSTYDYSINIYKAGFLQTYLPCSSGSGVIDYTFSDITSNTSYSAKLTKYVQGSMIPLLIDHDDCMVYLDSMPDSCQIEFDQEIYGPNDLVNMSYFNCPDGSHIIFRSDTSPYYDSKTYVSISGNGSVSYQLSGAPAGIGYYVKVCTPGNIIIASDTMEIEGVVVGYCQVHGGIYDSQDYHPLIGTVFIGDSYSDVVAYDDYGAYSITVPWGTYDISTVVSSYRTYNISNVEIFDSDYNLNMFMSVNGTTTHVFRGSVMDANTNAAIEDVLIKVYNDTFDEYDFTSQSGVWVVNGLTAGTNYTLHATKDDYHSYTYSFTYDPCDFYHNFMMSLVVSEDDDTEGDALEDDESMTEYFDEKFRGFAPTIWGLFMCMCVLFFMSILTSFNSGGKWR